MMKNKTGEKTKKSAQEVQDGIFREMSADERLKLGAKFWKLAQELRKLRDYDD